MLFECCNKKFKPEKVLLLYPDEGYENRTLYIAKCPKCGAIKATLKEFDIIKNQWIFDRGKPKKQRNLEEWINKKESFVTDGIQNKKIKYGNKSNMAFIYGITRLTPQGVIHSGYDWNNTERFRELVPVGFN